MSETKAIQPRLEIHSEFSGVKCADVTYSGKPHFMMYWSMQGQATMLDMDDAVEAFNHLGEWLIKHDHEAVQRWLEEMVASREQPDD